MTVESATAIINQLLPEPHAGLLAGIVFGTRATLAKELTDALITTGTLHIIALSGMNITIMTGLVESILRPLISRRLAILITIVLIIMFIVFVGPSPSIIRAGIMGCIGLIAISSGRQQWSLWALALAIIGMLVLYPPWLTDLSFQLSVLATLGIILFGTRQIGEGVKSALWRLIEPNLRLTLAAQVFTIPLIFLHFHRISMISPLANILIGWTIAPLTILGWLVATGGWVWIPLGRIAAWVSWVFLEYLIGTISVLTRIPLASVGFY